MFDAQMFLRLQPMPYWNQGVVRLFTLTRALHVGRYTWLHIYIYIYIYIKFSRYRPGVAQRVGRGIALLFHNRGTRRG